MQNKKEDIFTSFKIVCLFGKIFHTISFTIEGPSTNPKFLVTKFDIILRIIYSIIFLIVTYIFVKDNWINNSEFNLRILCSHSTVVLHLSLVLILLIFGIIHAKNIFDILKKLQQISLNLKTKNICISYKEVRSKCLIFIIIYLFIFIVGIFCNIEVFSSDTLLGIYTSIIATILKSLELQLFFFLYVFSMLLKALNIHINNNFQKCLVLKEAMLVHFDLFILGKFINKVYRIFIVKIFSVWFSTVSVSFIFRETIDNLTFSYFYSSFVLNVVNIVVISVIIYFYKTCQNEV